MKLVPAIIIGVALFLAPVLWVGLNYLLSEEDFQGSAVDSGARIEIEMLRQQVEDLQSRLKSMEGEVASLGSQVGRISAPNWPQSDRKDPRRVRPLLRP